MEEPLVVYGEQSRRYDFGPAHPLTPRRFGPGIDMLRELGARRIVEPETADDETLARVHDPAYVEAVRRCSETADDDPSAGLVSWGDNPPFAGMHQAAAIVAGGSLRAMEQILAGSARHAFHPGGGLHHAMPASASGFCVYNDPALAIARARDAGLRVLYVDVDVHHGDGVQTIFWRDPGVMTISIHETGAALFPGSGFLDETGGGGARGTKVNVPLEPGTGDASWLAALETVVPPLAEAFEPDVLVSQHGCDTHAFDPLAHVRLTTAAMARAARLLDELADSLTHGRWLATGGGGYDAYRVVPRVWGLVWLAQAHREVPRETPPAWRERWLDEAERYEQAPLPQQFIDPPDTVGPEPAVVVERNWKTTQRALDQALAERAMCSVCSGPAGLPPEQGQDAGLGVVAGVAAVAFAGQARMTRPVYVPPLSCASTIACWPTCRSAKASCRRKVRIRVVLATSMVKGVLSAAVTTICSLPSFEITPRTYW